MIEETADFLPIWMLLSAIFGFMAGEALGGQVRVRRYLEQENAELRDQLRKAQPDRSDLQRQLDQQRRVINDIHKRIAAVTKGLRKRPSQLLQNQWPDLTDPAVSKGIGFHTWKDAARYACISAMSPIRLRSFDNLGAGYSSLSYLQFLN
jgi:hypothetical protein